MFNQPLSLFRRPGKLIGAILAGAALMAACARTCAAAPLDDSLTRLQARIAQVARTLKGSAAVQVTDLESGRTAEVNAYADMPAASTIKIPVMVEVFRQESLGTLQAQDLLTLQTDDKDRGSGSLYRAQPGSSYSVEFLVQRMITVSDNTATNMLIRKVGIDNINATMRQLGLMHTVVADYIHTDSFTGDIRTLRSSPEDMALLLAAMYRGTLIDARSSQAMLQILCAQRHNSLIPKLLPKGLKIAHKTGTLSDTLNDVGIVFVGSHPYVLAVMTTRLLSKALGKAFIQSISRLVYNEQTTFDQTVSGQATHALKRFKSKSRRS